MKLKIMKDAKFSVVFKLMVLYGLKEVPPAFHPVIAAELLKTPNKSFAKDSCKESILNCSRFNLEGDSSRHSSRNLRLFHIQRYRWNCYMTFFMNYSESFNIFGIVGIIKYIMDFYWNYPRISKSVCRRIQLMTCQVFYRCFMIFSRELMGSHPAFL